MKPILFISHATVDKTLAEAVRDEFAAEFETFLDSDNAKAGDAWRPAIELGLLECHAALVLLSERSIDRDWVRVEAAMLAMLSRNLPGNRIVIPLLVDGLDVARLRDKGLEPAGLDANQARPIDSTNLDLAVVRERLQPLVEEFSQRTDLVEVECYVASKMDLFGCNAQEAIAKVLDLDVNQLRIAHNPGRWLASKLLALRDLDRFEDFIITLADHGGADGTALARELLFNIFPYCWVDTAVVHQLADQLSRRDIPRTAIGLVADRSDTPKCYVRCAAAKAPLASWRVLECTSAFSHEGSVEDVVREVMAQVGEVRRCPVPGGSEEPTQKLLDCWNQYTRRKGPLVVLLPACFSEFDGSYLDELNDKFKHLNFLIACRDYDPGLEQRFTNFKLLPLPEHQKEEADAVFDDVQDRLQPEQ